MLGWKIIFEFNLFSPLFYLQSLNSWYSFMVTHVIFTTDFCSPACHKYGLQGRLMYSVHISLFGVLSSPLMHHHHAAWFPFLSPECMGIYIWIQHFLVTEILDVLVKEISILLRFTLQFSISFHA